MVQKTFLLGVGCQKGGTTWLHRYLKRHAQCNMGLLKEYHVFDVMHGISGKAIAKRRMNDLISVAEEKKKVIEGDFEDGAAEVDPKLDKRFRDKMTIASLYTGAETYADYFHGLAHASEDIRVVGDITPTYSALSVEHYTQIRELMESRGFHVKVIFIMREPIERIFSAARMNVRDNEKRKSAVERFANNYNKYDAEIRTRYETTIENVEKVFDPKDINYSFFETLFSAEVIANITDFLEIDYVEPPIEEKANSSPKKEKLTPELIEAARTHYAPTYDFCMNKFGKGKIKDLWRHA